MAKKAKKTVKAKKAVALNGNKPLPRAKQRRKVAKSKPVKVKKVTAAKTSRSAVKVSKPKRQIYAAARQQRPNPRCQAR